MTFKTRRRAHGYVQPEWERSTSPIKVTVVFGQSRADNHSEGSAWCVYPRSTNPRVLMLNNPRAPGRAFQGPFDPATATSLIALDDCHYGSFADPGGHTAVSKDPLGQSLATGLWTLDAKDVAAGRPLRRRALIVAGEGGQKIAVLSKGAAPFVGSNGTFVIYDRMLAMVQRFKDLAFALYGQNIEVEGMWWLQGEADSLTATVASYYSALSSMVTNMTTDLMAITGQSYVPTFLMDQVASHTGDGAGNPASLAQLQLAVDNPNGHTFMVGPAYAMAVNSRDVDGGGATYHMNAQSVMVHGEQFGTAQDAIIRGQSPQLCRVTGWSLSGTTLTFFAETGTGSLVNDTDIPAATNKGFKLADPGGAAISSVTLGANTISIALSKAPSHGATVSYAYTNPGDPVGASWPSKLDLQGSSCSTASAWGSVRDSRADASAYSAGYSMHNFLCAFQQVIA